MSDRIRLSNSLAHCNPDEVNVEEYKLFFPALTVLVRDFALQLKDGGGNTITSKQYIDNAVASKPGSNKVNK